MLIAVIEEPEPSPSPDGEDYLALRAQSPRHGYPEECADPEVDQVVSDKGWYRGC